MTLQGPGDEDFGSHLQMVKNREQGALSIVLSLRVGPEEECHGVCCGRGTWRG